MRDFIWWHYYWWVLSCLLFASHQSYRILSLTGHQIIILRCLCSALNTNEVPESAVPWRRRKQTENSPRMMSSKELVKGNTEGNRIKISLPGPMKHEWKWRNCFFKVPLFQFINFNFLDTGEVESLNLKAQIDQNFMDFRFYLYPAFKNE